MSNLNPTAFSFVPGQVFMRNLQQQPPQNSATPPLAPIERPPQTEAPAPPPTIKLNIGGSTPTPPAPLPQSPSTPNKPPTPSVSKSSSIAPSPAPPATKPTKNFNFSLEKSKTDSDAILQEANAVADDEILKDLYGDKNQVDPNGALRLP
jgi:peptide chain release factor subunit 3